MGTFIRFILIGALLPMAACSFKKNENKPKEPDAFETIANEQEKQEAEGILSADNVKVTFEEMPEPNSYKMKIAWPTGIRKVQVNVDDQNEQYVSQKNQYEEIVDDNSDLKIRLKSLDQFGSPISSIEITAKSPRDIVIDKDRNLTEDTIFEGNRLFLIKDAMIKTRGFGLSIYVNKIIIQTQQNLTLQDAQWWKSAHIITAIPGNIASESRDLHGSYISITAKEAHGHLKVALIGMNGQNGKDGSQILLERGLDTEKVDTSLNGGNGSAGAVKPFEEFCPFNQDLPCPPARDHCSTQPTPGTPGKAGAPGIPGEDGWPGGNTGNLVVVVENSTDFSISVGKLRGKPGAGGIGSMGFVGGIGGQPGSGPAPCGTAAPGANGDRGAKGADGHSGAEASGEFINLGPFKSEIKEL